MRVTMLALLALGAVAVQQPPVVSLDLAEGQTKFDQGSNVYRSGITGSKSAKAEHRHMNTYPVCTSDCDQAPNVRTIPHSYAYDIHEHDITSKINIHRILVVKQVQDPCLDATGNGFILSASKCSRKNNQLVIGADFVSQADPVEVEQFDKTPNTVRAVYMYHFDVCDSSGNCASEIQEDKVHYVVFEDQAIPTFSWQAANQVMNIDFSAAPLEQSSEISSYLTQGSSGAAGVTGNLAAVFAASDVHTQYTSPRGNIDSQLFVTFTAADSEISCGAHREENSKIYGMECSFSTANVGKSFALNVHWNDFADIFGVNHKNNFISKVLRVSVTDNTKPVIVLGQGDVDQYSKFLETSETPSTTSTNDAHACNIECLKRNGAARLVANSNYDKPNKPFGYTGTNCVGYKFSYGTCSLYAAGTVSDDASSGIYAVGATMTEAVMECTNAVPYNHKKGDAIGIDFHDNYRTYAPLSAFDHADFDVNAGDDLTSKTTPVQVHYDTAATIENKIVWKQTFSYSYTDGAGNSADAVSRVVKYEDTKAPTIELTKDEQLGNIVEEMKMTHLTEDAISFSSNGQTITCTLNGDKSKYDCKLDNGKTVDISAKAGAGSEPLTFQHRSGFYGDQTYIADLAKFGTGWDCTDDCNGQEVTTSTHWSQSGCGVGDDKLIDTYSSTTVGTYFIQYRCQDLAGNEAATKCRTIINEDKQKPVMKLVGKDQPFYEATEVQMFTDMGAECKDSIDGNIGHMVTIEGSIISLARTGEFKITYNCKDKSGNVAQPIFRTVTIADTTCPTCRILGNAHEDVEASFKYTDEGVQCQDTLTGSVTVNAETEDSNGDVVFQASEPGTAVQGLVKAIDGKTRSHTDVVFGKQLVNEQITGTYKITYTATDSHGNYQGNENDKCKILLDQNVNADSSTPLEVISEEYTPENLLTRYDTEKKTWHKKFDDEDLKQFDLATYIEASLFCLCNTPAASRTVTVKDTLAPVVGLEVGSVSDAAKTYVHSKIVAQAASESTSSGAKHDDLGNGIAMKTDPAYQHTLDTDGGHATAGKWMAEEATTGPVNGWVIGAVASAVSGLALLGYAATRKATKVATSVPV